MLASTDARSPVNCFFLNSYPTQIYHSSDLGILVSNSLRYNKTPPITSPGPSRSRSLAQGRSLRTFANRTSKKNKALFQKYQNRIKEPIPSLI